MIVPKMLYKVLCIENFKDGNMPPGYQTLQVNKVYSDIPGSVLLRIQRSSPGCFEVMEYKPIQSNSPEVKLSQAAEKLLDEFPIPVEDIVPTGKDGTILKSDVEKYLAD